MILLTVAEALKVIVTHGSDWLCPKQALMTSLQKAFQADSHVYDNKYGYHQIKSYEVLFKNPWFYFLKRNNTQM